MKNNFKIFQIVLLMCGVFGAGTDEVKTVSVMEGESVTLNPDLTQIQGINLMKWRFTDPLIFGSVPSFIAQIDRNDISLSPSLLEMFKDRLTLDQTGSLTITNTRTKHSGLYKLEINHDGGTSYLNFRVTVNESPAVIEAFKGETKSVSETEGNSVSLQTDIKTHTKELIVWRFGDEGKLIAKHDLETKSLILYDDPDERFRDRLKLDHQTGSLTITKIRITDSGVYKVKISRSKQILQKRFTVTVSAVPVPPLSSSAVAGIVVAIFLLAFSAAGVLYYRHKVSEVQKQTMKTINEGESVTLTSGIEINKDDQIQWLFGDEKKTVIAEIQRGTGEITVPHDGRFRGRLEMDKKTGSLIITNTSTDDTGVYELKIRGGRLVQNMCRRLVQNLNKTFIVSVKDVSVSVMKGADVTLRVNTEIQTGDKIFWMFGHDNRLVAKNTEEKCKEESEFSDSRFKGRVDLNRQTGDLTIKKIKPDHTGKYKLKIIRNGKSSLKIFTVTVSAAEQVNESVLKGRPVTLNYDTEIQEDDKIQWKFGEKLIAEMTGENREKPQWTDEFRDQMKLDSQTGSLFIQQTRPEHSGLYKLEINTSDYSTFRLFSLIVCDEEKSVSMMKGADMTLCANPEIQTGDKIFWMFGHDNSLVAKNTEEKCEEESEFRDYRFKDIVDLNPQTGDLTIKKIRYDHAGEYKLKIIRNGKVSFKIFNVFVSNQVNESVLKGCSFALDYYAEIQKDDKIQWKFGEKLIVKMTGENRENPQWTDDEFRDQMKLDPQTGSLLIQQTRPEHTGLYKLEIKTRDDSTFRLFSLIVCDKVKSVPVMEGEDVTLRVNPEIQTGDEIFWMFGDYNHLVATNTGEKCEEESKYSDSRFKPNVDLNRQTGDLTIKRIKTDHTGEYKLKIIRNGKSSFKLFNVFVSGQVNKSVLKGDSVFLNSYTEIQKDDKIQWKFGEKLIAKMTGVNRKDPQWTDDEFRDQMKLHPWTGSLTIQQTRPEHAGLYKLEINTSDYSTFRFFNLIVSDEEKSVSVMKGEDVTLRANTGKQTGDKSGDDNCPVAKNTEDACSYEVKSVPVMEGADVTLRAKIQTGDKIFWRFRDDNRFLDKNTEEESEYRDFGNKDTVVLNRQTGDLTIKKISTDHTGKYKLKIIRNDKSSFKLFKVTVSGRQVNKSVLKGDSVTLNYDTEIREDGKIQWKFETEEKLIVEMTGENRENPQWSDEFRDQMKLDPQTGSLTIQQTRPEHSGLYKIEIKTRDDSASILFRLIVCDEVKSVSVTEGEDVTLRVNTEIQTGDKIFWMFGDYDRLVAKNTEEKCEEETECSDEYRVLRFTDNVDLNPQTGDLTIRTIRTFHTGEYKLKIIRNGKASFKLFSVFVSPVTDEERKPLMNDSTEKRENESVTVEMNAENRDGVNEQDSPL